MIYVVMNGYQGIAYFASSENKAREYVTEKVAQSRGDDCWVESAWEIVPQNIDAEIQFEVNYG